jgi:uncharacterized small protein (DUF1192 family)
MSDALLTEVLNLTREVERLKLGLVQLQESAQAALNGLQSQIDALKAEGATRSDSKEIDG